MTRTRKAWFTVAAVLLGIGFLLINAKSLSDPACLPYLYAAGASVITGAIAAVIGMVRP